jgi:dTMP kinase
MTKGLFITLEGVDAAGKSSHLRSIQAYLQKATGKSVLLTREPGGTPLAEQLRAIVKTQEMSPETATLLLNAGRRDHIEKVIRPHLESGGVVLCDRFTDSTFAYQGGAMGLSLEKIESLKEWTQEGLNPDLTLYFDVPLEVSKQRREKRGEANDKLEDALDANFTALRNVYLKLAEQEPGRIKVIDGSPTIEQVSRVVLECLTQLLEEQTLNRKVRRIP